ncbi:hypothetical protein [Kitasatospora cineracea]|uniref:hypothetical protein n=1 Tax=Kitasatospora cineracea TaxID=88074 RepID=UPI0033C228E4
MSPTAHRAEAPADRPTARPAEAPTAGRTIRQTGSLDDNPATRPAEADAPTTRHAGTDSPTPHRTGTTADRPTGHQAEADTGNPTRQQTEAKTDGPTDHRAEADTGHPTAHPAEATTGNPTTHPAEATTDHPTTHPAEADTNNPTRQQAEAEADGPAAHRAGATARTVRARAAWPEPGESGAPAMPAGFIASTFPALVATVADRCLRRGYGEPGGPAAGGGERRTAVVLVSERGDQGTLDAVAAAVDGGRRMQPLLFFQSVPNAVLGWVAARWELVGPVVCVSPGGDPVAEGLELADLLIEDGDADDVLLLLADQAAGPDQPDRPDRATAFLITRPS